VSPRRALAALVAALAAAPVLPPGADTTALRAASTAPVSRSAGCPAGTAPAEAGAGPVGPAGADRLRLATLHTLATGRGQRVAVIDTGVAPHPRLAGRLVGLGDYLAGGDGLADCDGHGTAVAGLIAARADRGDDLVGVAPDAKILSLRQFSPSVDGAGHPTGDLASLADALLRAVRARATVVNISGAVCLPRARAAAAGAPVRAALDAALAADVVVVAAAGNADGGGCAADDPAQVALPGWFGDDLLAVGAVDAGDRPAPFTVRGPWVDVAAPGTGVRSLAPDGGTGPPQDGTSFAAPYVAGLAALIRERRPDLTAREVADRIVATARRPADGRDDAVGAGVVDPVAALTAEPAVLHPDAAVRTGTAPLARSAPEPSPAAWPLGAVALMVVAAGAALRPRPADRHRPDRR
jgi:membrane-anchored mycosin MYCP